MLKKRGMAAGQLVIIILVLVAFMLIASVTYGFTKKAEKKSPGLLCHDTIAIRAANTVSIGKVDVPLSPVICETQDEPIKGNREELKKQLANLMAGCWWMFHEGKYEEILNDRLSIRSFFNFRGDNMCFVCYNVAINEKEIDGGPITREEMERYLRETKHKKYKDISYLDYIQSFGGPGSAFVLGEIRPKEAYGVVFMAKNEEGEGLAWNSYTEVFFATAFPIISSSIVALKAKRKFYDKDERDISVIVLDHLKSVNYASCDSTLYAKP